MKRILFIFFLFMFVVTVKSYAAYFKSPPPVTVTGQVKDAQGGPIPGVTVKVQGTTIGTQTDANGKFQIQAPNDATLVFSFIGFADQSVKLNGQTVLNITLLESTIGLQEVVAVGYGTQKRSEITGSSSSVSAKEIAKRPITQISQALQGTAAGVSVSSANGQPGQGPQVQIRGANSITGNTEPLYVTDGNIGAAPDDPNDVESIEILKDAASTAIYGSRGSNGVVLITTKSGHTGKARIEFNTWVQNDQMPKTLDLMGAYDFARSVNNQFESTGQTDAFTQAQLNSFRTNGGGTNWQNALFTKPWVKYYNVAVSGGSDAVTYRVSLGYLDQPGTILNTFYKRTTFKSNTDFKLNKKMDVKIILSASLPQNHNNSYGGGLTDPFNQAVEWDPTSPIKDATGAYISHSKYASIQFNPVEQALSQADDGSATDLNGTATFNYHIINDLTFTSTDVYSVGQNYLQRLFGPGTSQYDSGAGYINNETSKTTGYLSSNFLTYHHKFGDNSITATGLYEVQSGTATDFIATAKGLSTYSLGYYNLGLGGSQQTSSTYSSDALVSYLARVQYNYKEKYFLTASVRTDGSSHLIQKYSTFPSLGVSWNASNEDFLKDSKIFSDLKIRATYGQTGNQNVGAYSTIAQIGTAPGQSPGAQPAYYYNGGTPGAAGTPSVATPLGTGVSTALNWETKTAYDLGVDMAFLKGRLTFTVDAYKDNVNNLLYAYPATYYDGGGTYQRNIGSLTNDGVEFALGGTPVESTDFKWHTNITLSINRNKVTSLGGLDNQVVQSGNNTVNAILKVGQPLGEFYGYKFLGTWKTSEAAQAALYGMKPGDAKYLDVNGDHTYNSDDYQLLGNANPQFTYGFINDFTYKNFTLSFMFQGQQGGQIFSQTLAYLWGGLGDMKNATTIEAVPENLWTPSHQTNNPAWSSTSVNYNNSSRYVYNDSYAKLKNLSLSYRVPAPYLQKISVNSLEVYVSGQNLLTITPYKGFDPEVSNATNAITQGQEFGVIPNPKTFTIGIRLGL
ncbi:TonB-linked SusC/RagA family outer membrane protein [Mucilaginibacter frigoritolerans]|uniref:TonB-linked SusC/RagA family outer membrane protein n=1 Tax=Mucilaginibacter frigoritolerans TaxID=652788 RepID=A0A562TLZ4_9SPHI|nr:TonB-dependent receptor [Mucilaginibacter frigoritolerans]TWI94565.1 TonB-linked SusC/RagA family outer membrane protein [Mucilaginibacter frigoritolerans]